MRAFWLLAVFLVAVFSTGCKSLPGPLGGQRDHLVDVSEFDPKAGVSWADEGPRPVGVDLKKQHPIFIVDVTVIDGSGTPARPHQDILIDEKGRIAEMGRTGEIVPPKGTEKIKIPGATAMPGFVDLLAFASTGGGPAWDPNPPGEQRTLEANLYTGVTTVVTGGDAGRLTALRSRIQSGEILGPQIFLTSPIVTFKGGYPAQIGKSLLRIGGGIAREVSDSTDAKSVINSLADDPAKFDVIPVFFDFTPAGFGKMPPDLLKSCVDRIHSRGRKVFVWTGTVDDAAQAAAEGVDAIVHGVYEEPLDDVKTPKLALLLQLKNVVVIPALVEMWGKATSLGGQPFPVNDLEKETVDPDALAAFTTLPKKLEGMFYQYAQSLGPQIPVAAANIGKLAAWRGEGDATLAFGGGSGAAGPGLMPGAALHRELGLMVKSGLTPEEAIASVTGRAARLLREDKADFGLLAMGKRADILIVEGDVKADIANTQRIRAVIAGGRLIERVPVGQWETRQKARQASSAPKADADADDSADAKTDTAPGTPKKKAKKKKKRSTGADEDPAPIGGP